VFAGIGFAVPINQAKAILDELVHKGRVVRGWLGVELAREITPAIVKTFALPDDKGALVNDVMKNSPAEKAGLKRGDVIRSFDGKPTPSSDGLQNLVAQTPPRKSVEVVVIRDKKQKTLTLVLAERPESADVGEDEESANALEKKDAKPEQKEWLGAKVVNVTSDLAENFQQPRDAEGVLVVDVDAGSRADDIGLVPGDLIRAVNQVPTPNVETFHSATGKVKLSQGVVLDILRQGHPMYLSFTKE